MARPKNETCERFTEKGFAAQEYRWFSEFVVAMNKVMDSRDVEKLQDYALGHYGKWVSLDNASRIIREMTGIAGLEPRQRKPTRYGKAPDFEFMDSWQPVIDAVCEMGGLPSMFGTELSAAIKKETPYAAIGRKVVETRGFKTEAVFATDALAEDYATYRNSEEVA